MTRITVQIFVRTIKPESGLRAVIELPQEPAVRVVAAFTIWSQGTLMFIICLMAFDTGERRLMKGRSKVTFLAWRCCMQPQQWESRNVMIKKDAYTPASIVVATTAVVTELPRMRVDKPVAGLASGIRSIVSNAASVAGFARHFSVTIVQLEIGVDAVIENSRLPRY